MSMLLPKLTDTPELELVCKNDEHYESITSDSVFMKVVMERNEEANQLMNLNNADLTKAGDNAAQNGQVLVVLDERGEHWINHRWRPVMGWMYALVCFCDFILFPILWSVFQAAHDGSITTPWQPITLQGAGLFHIAMGAVLGIAVYGRTREKIEGVVSPSQK